MALEERMNKLTQMAQQRAAVQPPQPQQGAQTFLQRAAQSSEEKGESKKIDTKAEEKGEKFSGIISYDGQPVKVSNGIANLNGTNINISDDGHTATDGAGKPLGIIMGGKLLPIPAGA